MPTNRISHDAVRALFRAYLAEYGADGYDADTFLDYVNAAIRPASADGPRALVSIYARCAERLRRPDACPKCDSGDVTAALRLPPNTWKCQTCGAVWRTRKAG